MSDEVAGVIDRLPTLQTVTWLLSLRKYGQLDLDPPYQRKSVWTLREKRRFLDTVLRNYPSPAIFLHRSLDDEGNPTYHVVDGKQRLTTILDFADNKIRLADDFGDSRLDRQNWKGLAEYPKVRKTFWGYQLTVEFIDDVHEPLVRDIFSRLNQNSRKLERQELRHARFDGWLINFVESEAEAARWKALKVSTSARSRRMTDAQILLEYANVLVQGEPVGFDQDQLDELCAEYDEPDARENFDVDLFIEAFERATMALEDVASRSEAVEKVLSSRNDMYSLWSCVALAPELVKVAGFQSFFNLVEAYKAAERSDPQRDRSGDDPDVGIYVANSVGAATEQPQRRARHAALVSYLSRS